jgi:Phage integrase central domain/Arm DNA-binding domain
MTLHRGKLTARYVETAALGAHDDGRGLRLIVRKSGAKSWILRYQINHRRRDMGLGRYPETTLAMARERALAIRREIDTTRRDPLIERQRAKGLLFKAAAETLIESKESGWRNAKHRQQWANTLKTYAYPKLGTLDVKAVDTQGVLDVLRPIWSTKPETASRLRQRIEAVLDYATAIGARRGDNPARWRGHLDHLLPKPSKVKQVEHHAALDWRQAPAFMLELAKRDGSAAKALAFAIMTAARSGEVRGMAWGEVDDTDSVWTVPAEAEAAYARGDLFVKRRKLMEDWAAFLAKAPGEIHQMSLPAAEAVA